MTYRSIHDTFPSYLQTTVMLHPRFRHYVQTTATVLYLTSYENSTLSSLYSRPVGVSGFWCYSLERPASPRRICTVTRGFQTTTQDLSVKIPVPIARHSSDSCTITIYHYCLDTCSPCNNYLGHVKNVYDDDDEQKSRLNEFDSAGQNKKRIVFNKSFFDCSL